MVLLWYLLLFSLLQPLFSWRFTPCSIRSKAYEPRSLLLSLRSFQEESTASKIDLEVFFCGEPRLPPSPYFLLLEENPVWILKWARNDLSIPRNSLERQSMVFPESYASTRPALERLDERSLSFIDIIRRFSSFIENSTLAKQFISINLDLVSPAYFSHALIMAKFAARYKDDTQTMMNLHRIFQSYRANLDSFTFPLHVELLKAETRVATYLLRKDLAQFAELWDSIETNCFLIILLASHLKWTLHSLDQEGFIESKGEATPFLFRYEEKMKLRKSFLRNRLTAHVYEQAVNRFLHEIPELKSKVFPELLFVVHSFNIHPDDLVRYANVVFCSEHNLKFDDLKRRLLVLSNLLDSISLQADFKVLPQYMLDLFMILASEEEVNGFQKWYSPDDFEYQPYFVNDDESLATFNALEKLFSENLMDLPLDLLSFRGVPDAKLSKNGILSSESEEWVARDLTALYDLSSDALPSSDQPKLSFPGLFLKHLEEGRMNHREMPINRSLLLEHEMLVRNVLQVKE